MKGLDTDGDTFTLALSGANASSFNMVLSSSGKVASVFVNETTVLDYESSKTKYSLTMTATDTNSAAARTLDFSIVVTDELEPPAAPAAPQVTTTTSAATSMSLSWSAPDNTGPAINDYDVQYREKDASPEATWSSLTHIGTTTTASITGLTDATTYEVQVRAKNPEGTGAWSASGTGTPGTASAPHGAGIRPGNGEH